MKEGVKYCFYIFLELVYGECVIGFIIFNLIFIFDVELLEVILVNVEGVVE